MISTKCLNIREVGKWKFKVQCPVLPGTCPGLAAERAATVPRAAPAPTIKPNLINNDRVLRCFGGAIATPAGFEAAPPLTWTGGATAVPVGCDDCGVCVLLAVEFPCGALLEPALTLPGLSGNSTGVALEFDGEAAADWFCVPDSCADAAIPAPLIANTRARLTARDKVRCIVLRPTQKLYAATGCG